MSLQCPICYITYDIASHVPRMLPKCGHTLCAICLAELLRRNLLHCPFDKVKYDLSSSQRKIDDFPVNFAIRELLGDSLRFDMCSKHSNKMDMVCMTDKERVCAECVLSSHHNHEYKKIIDFNQEIETRKKILEDNIEQVETDNKQNMEMLGKRRREIDTATEEWFDQQIFMIKKLKQEVLYETACFFSSQREKIEVSSGRYSIFQKTLTDKVKSLRQFKINEEILSLESDDIVQYLLRNQAALLKMRTECTQDKEKGLLEISEEISTWFVNRPNIDLESIKIRDSLAKINRIQPENNPFVEPIEQFLIPNPTDIRIPFSLTILFDKNLLIGHRITDTEYFLSRHQANTIKDVNIKFSIFLLDEERIIHLKNLIQQLPNPETLKIDFIPDPLIKETMVLNILPVIINSLKKLTTLSLHLTNLETFDESAMVLLLEKLSSNISHLKNFVFDCKKPFLTTRSIDVLSSKMIPRMKNLEDLSLGLSTMTVNEDALVGLFKSIPSMKELSLDLSNIKLSNKTMDVLFLQTLPKIDLTSLSLDLSSTPIPNKRVVDLLMNLPNLKSLVLNLRGSKVSDESIKNFIEKKIPLMKKLSKLSLKLASGLISSAMKERVRSLEEVLALRES